MTSFVRVARGSDQTRGAAGARGAPDPADVDPELLTGQQGGTDRELGERRADQDLVAQRRQGLTPAALSLQRGTGAVRRRRTGGMRPVARRGRARRQLLCSSHL